MSRIVVIGAGLAGLAAACHLRGAGHDVVIVEKQAQAGGRGIRLERDGFTFDTGPTVLTMIDLVDEALAQIGVGVHDVTLTLYPGARHEILHETNRDEVVADILAWLDAHV